MANYDLTTIRHSAAHIMAAAINNLFPGTTFDIGPATEDGFYYDVDTGGRLGENDLPRIQEEMQRIIKEQHPFQYKEMSREQARQFLEEQGQKYKVERLEDIPEGQKITFYETAGFTDLCGGPHVEHTGQIKAFRLLSVAGSYYRGDERNPMLERIYGTAFHDKKALKKYIQHLEEARKRDHRRLGKELDLFSVNSGAGPGLICWHPKGALVRHIIESYWRDQHYKNGYELLYTPHLGQADLWETSGHLDFYSDSMYAPMQIDEQDYYMKPMNCPFHIQVYKSRNRSYRELPLRWAELGTVYRYEKSGVLHGLLRVRGFTQDDAHIICTPEQVEDEIRKVLDFSISMWQAFGFQDIKAYLATQPSKAVGEADAWTEARQSLENAVEAVGLQCEVEEGGGAFYGPKIDLKIQDALGREWQTSTIQFDFNIPERFDMTYVGTDGNKHRPYMVHRALLGSLERFFGILLEHYAGAFPLWLAPEQVRVLPVGENYLSYARQVKDELRAADVRADVDADDDTVGAKIRKARNARLPYMLVVGAEEEENALVAVRSRKHGEEGKCSVNEFLQQLEEKAKAGE